MGKNQRIGALDMQRIGRLMPPEYEEMISKIGRAAEPGEAHAGVVGGTYPELEDPIDCLRTGLHLAARANAWFLSVSLNDTQHGSDVDAEALEQLLTVSAATMNRALVTILKSGGYPRDE